MNRKTKIFFILLIILLLPGIVYLLYPLQTDEFIIPVNTESLSAKEAYLSKPVQPADSNVNILWIIVDDLGMADTDLYGDGPVSVPNIRKMAARGVTFTNAYVSSPVCSPSRAAIVTGRYNQRFGYEHQLHERYLANRLEYYGFKYLIDSDPWVPQYQTTVPDETFIANMGMPESEITLAEVLGKHGYSSGYFGKWHLGKKPENTPLAFGFDHFYGFMASHSLYVPEGTEGYTDQKIPEDFTDEYIWEGQRNGLHAIQKDGEFIQESRYLTDAITDETIAFLEDNQNRPFYSVAAYNAPHTPLQAPNEYLQQYEHIDDPYQRMHYAMIKSLDDGIGRLMDYLENSGLSKNTLVFFISDNGGAEYNLTTSNGPYQGGKITNFEGGVKVPMIASWPGVLPENVTYDKLVHATDLFVTSAVAAGAELPGDRLYDGAVLTEAVRRNSPAHQYVYFRMGANGGIRDASWKLTWNEHNGDSSLFKIDQDPYELDDIFGEHPEVTGRLTEEFRYWEDGNAPPLWPSMIYYYYTDVQGKVHYFDE